MVTVRSDEERVQSIINFFKDYKFYILAVILASAILVGGYFFSKSVKSNQIQAAKVLYEDWQETQVQEDREQLFQNLTESYSDTGYSHLALLKRGSDLAKENNLEESLDIFYQLKENSDGFFGNNLMNGIARTNIARISIALGNFEDALAVLEKYSNDEDAYTHELKGDALSGVGNYDLALQQYQSAFEKYTDNGLRNLVELKINNLNTMNKIFSLILILSISSCSSIAFWQSDEIDPDEPRELVDFNERFEFIENWEKKFKGENNLNNFIPAFSGGSLFFVDQEGNVSNMDIESGEVLWETELETTISAGIVAGFGKLFLSDDQGNLISLDQEDGSILWKSFAGGEVLANVDVDAGLVIVKTASGFLNAFNIETGSEEWSYRSVAPNLTVRGSSSPVINDNIVYATFDNGRIGAFNLKTGLPIWDGAISFTEGVSELDNLIDADSSPVLEGNRIYTVNFQGNLSVFDAAQRRMVWESQESSFYEPFILRGVLGIISADSKISTYSSRTFEDSWKLEEYVLRELSNPETFKGYILVGDFEGYIHAIDPLTGITVARKKVSRNKITTLISRSDSFYAIDEKMRLFSLSF